MCQGEFINMNSITINSEKINNGFIKNDCKQQVIKYFCSAIFYECAKNSTKDIDFGYNAVLQEISKFSSTHTVTSRIKQVKYSSMQLLEYFFEPKKSIPAYIYYWVLQCYAPALGNPGENNPYHSDIYVYLQGRYFNYRQQIKAEERELAKLQSVQRRKLCKLYRDGKYADIFKSYSNKSYMNLVGSNEFEDIQLILSELYGDMFADIEYPEDVATAFVLGMIQGRAQASQ